MRRSLQLFALAIAAAAGGTVGCVIHVEDDCGAVDCGLNAACDRGQCECALGYDGDPTEACDPIQTLLIEDACDDGLDIEFAVFATEREWRWPAGADVYATRGYRLNTQVDIVCYEGEWICMGAQSGSLAWGVGLDGADTCVDDWCCLECYADTYDLGVLACD